MKIENEVINELLECDCDLDQINCQLSRLFSQMKEHEGIEPTDFFSPYKDICYSLEISISDLSKRIYRTTSQVKELFGITE